MNTSTSEFMRDCTLERVLRVGRADDAQVLHIIAPTVVTRAVQTEGHQIGVGHGKERFISVEVGPSKRRARFEAGHNEIVVVVSLVRTCGRAHTGTRTVHKHGVRSSIKIFQNCKRSGLSQGEN